MPVTDGTTLHDLARAMLDESSEAEEPAEGASGVADPDQAQEPEAEGDTLPADRGEPEADGGPGEEGAAATEDTTDEEFEVFIDPETGTEYTADQILEALRGKKGEDPKQEHANLLAALKEELLAELRPQQQEQQRTASAPPSFPDPILQSEQWLRARYQFLVSQGLEDSDATVSQARFDLLQAQNIRNHQLIQEQQTAGQRKEAEAAAAREAAARSKAVETAIADKPNLQTEAGQEYLQKALAYAEKMGETDVAKVVAEANEFLSRFVSQDYLNKKRKVARLLKGGRMPKAGSPPAPVPKQEKMRYDGFDSLRDMARKAMMDS